MLIDRWERMSGYPRGKDLVVHWEHLWRSDNNNNSENNDICQIRYIEEDSTFVTSQRHPVRMKWYELTEFTIIDFVKTGIRKGSEFQDRETIMNNRDVG